MSREGIIITKNKYNLVYITKEWNIWMNVRNRGIAFFQFLFLDSFFYLLLKNHVQIQLHQIELPTKIMYES